MRGGRHIRSHPEAKRALIQDVRVFFGGDQSNGKEATNESAEDDSSDGDYRKLKDLQERVNTLESCKHRDGLDLWFAGDAPAEPEEPSYSPPDDDVVIQMAERMDGIETQLQPLLCKS